MTDTDKLFDRIDSFPYPDSMALVAGDIPGVAFFPGGKGTFDNKGDLTNRDIMILGQDFDCEKNYQKAFQAGYEDTRKNATWRNLLAFLGEVNVSKDDCFFTNAIQGIRKGDSGTGKSPAFKDKHFIKSCQEFFLYQLEIQKPKLIFVLGKHVAEFLCSTSKDLSCWSSIKNFTTVDQENNQIITATFENGINSHLVLLTHPSYRPVNVHRRRYLDHAGHEAEIMMTKAIIDKTNT
jgi:hypothetical protein